MTKRPKWFLFLMLLWNFVILEKTQTNIYHPFFIFVWMSVFLKNCGILRKYFFCKSCARIHKNGLTHKFCTILEWDKCQQFADFIKCSFFSFTCVQMCKTSLQFFLDQTLPHFKDLIYICLEPEAPQCFAIVRLFLGQGKNYIKSLTYATLWF